MTDPPDVGGLLLDRYLGLALVLRVEGAGPTHRVEVLWTWSGLTDVVWWTDDGDYFSPVEAGGQPTTQVLQQGDCDVHVV